MDDIRVIDDLQNIPLGLGVLDLVAGDDCLLLEDLHREDLAIILFSHQHHLAEASTAQHLQQVKVVEIDLALLDWDGNITA